MDDDADGCVEIKSAIVMTDNVDIEWDIEDQLKRVWNHLPDDWDILHLGTSPPLSLTHQH